MDCLSRVRKLLFFLFVKVSFLFSFFTFALFSPSLFAVPKKKILHKQENMLVQENRLTYPQAILFHILPVEFQGRSEKKYLTTVLESLFSDQLTIQRNVYLTDVSPSQIVYKQQDSYSQEDEYRPHDFLKSGLFSLKITRGKPEQKSNEDFFLIIALDETSEKKFKLKILLTRLNNSLYKHEAFLQENNMLAQVISISEEIRGILAGKQKGRLKINSFPEQASVYIDGFYFGKTPFQLNNIAEGNYRVVLRKQKYAPVEDNIHITVQQVATLTVDLKEASGPGQISVLGTPKQVKIYLNQEFMGLSPLLLQNVPLGFHRITLQKEGYQDYYNDFKITENNNAFKINPILLETNAKTIDYRILAKRNLNGSKALFILSAAFAVSGVAMLIERDKRLQRDYRNLYGVGSSDWQKNQKELKTFEALSLGFFIGAGILLIGGGVLYVKYLNALNKKFRYTGKGFTTLPRLSFSPSRKEIAFKIVMNY